MIVAPERAPATTPVRNVPAAAILVGALWLWAIWSCAEHWRGNPNYSYGWLVPILAFGFAIRRLAAAEKVVDSPLAMDDRRDTFRATGLFAIATGLLVFGLEFGRQEMWHPQIVLWSICLLAVIGSIGVVSLTSGWRTARKLIFPSLFFLTAVPWPPRFEQPITANLMRFVAEATAELLHWLGIEAQTSGAAIALRGGLVGITEACSGIRSLQAGIMFGFAVGEWFLLRPGRRVALLAIAIALAIATNLVRTVGLSLQAEWHGLSSVARVHDLLGNIVITALVVGIWIAGRLLAPVHISAAPAPLAAREVWNRFTGGSGAAERPRYSAILAAGLVSFVAVRLFYAHLEAQAHTQTSPYFKAHLVANENELIPIPEEIWNELRPTSGEYVSRRSADLPGGTAACYHFFWKPSPWNRFALVHRPDICMPGVGWELAGSPEPVDVTFGAGRVRCYAFRFRRGATHALELWGVWRNGDAVPLDYQPAQVLGAAVAPPSMHLEGKRRSATEIVACSLVSDTPPPTDIAVALMRSVFEYTPQ